MFLQGSTSPPGFEIPTFTVTINPLESNEMTFVPGSPPTVECGDSVNNGGGENQHLLQNNQDRKWPEVKAGNGNLSERSIANMTVIVDDEVNHLLLHNNGQVSLCKKRRRKKNTFFCACLKKEIENFVQQDVFQGVKL